MEIRACRLLTMALAAVVCSAQTAFATCWGPNPPCGRYWTADAVFIGTVTKVAKRVQRISAKMSRHETEVHLTVVEGFRGTRKPMVTLWDYGSDEFVKFEKGTTYFVYAFRSPDTGRLTASSCETTVLAEAQDSVEYARWIGNVPSAGRVFGTIAHEQADVQLATALRQPPLHDILVTLTGSNGTWQAVAAADGTLARFSFDQVPVGKYQLKVVPNASFRPPTVQDVEVRSPQLCEEVWVPLSAGE